MTVADRLRALASAATPGPLTLWRYPRGGGRLSKDPDTSHRELVADFYQEGDREFYGAMSPERVRALADLVDAAEADAHVRGASIREVDACEVCYQDWPCPNVQALARVKEAFDEP